MLLYISLAVMLASLFLPWLLVLLGGVFTGVTGKGESWIPIVIKTVGFICHGTLWVGFIVFVVCLVMRFAG